MQPLARRGGSGRARAAAGGAAEAAAAEGGTTGGARVVRDRAFYQAWLKALRTLRFGRLSRAAQIDYLYVKALATRRAARAGAAPAAAPPRKADGSGIAGDPLGREGIVADLEEELIPYAPEELIAIGERELAWCEREMRRAAREMGFGDDWRAALEKVKTEPGVH